MNKTRNQLQKEIDFLKTLVESLDESIKSKDEEINSLKRVIEEKDKECEFNQLNSHSVIDRLESEKESWVMKFQTTKNELDRSNRMREEQQLIDIQLQTEIERQVQVIKKQYEEILNLKQIVIEKNERIEYLEIEHDQCILAAKHSVELKDNKLRDIESKTFSQLIKWWCVMNIKSNTFRQIFKRWWDEKDKKI